MSALLYPLKFSPIYKQIVWGGNNISKYFHRIIPLDTVAESWELCCRDDGTSVVSSGALMGMDLQCLILIYGGQLLGKKNYQKFGNRLSPPDKNYRRQRKPFGPGSPGRRLCQA